MMSHMSQREASRFSSLEATQAFNDWLNTHRELLKLETAFSDLAIQAATGEVSLECSRSTAWCWRRNSFTVWMPVSKHHGLMDTHPLPQIPFDMDDLIRQQRLSRGPDPDRRLRALGLHIETVIRLEPTATILDCAPELA
jgi:hypothetical protein